MVEGVSEGLSSLALPFPLLLTLLLKRSLARSMLMSCVLFRSASVALWEELSASSVNCSSTAMVSPGLLL